MSTNVTVTDEPTGPALVVDVELGPAVTVEAGLVVEPGAPEAAALPDARLLAGTPDGFDFPEEQADSEATATVPAKTATETRRVQFPKERRCRPAPVLLVQTCERGAAAACVVMPTRSTAPL